jgi:hypothetical protein
MFTIGCTSSISTEQDLIPGAKTIEKELAGRLDVISANF